MLPHDFSQVDPIPWTFGMGTGQCTDVQGREYIASRGRAHASALLICCVRRVFRMWRKLLFESSGHRWHKVVYLRALCLAPCNYETEQDDGISKMRVRCGGIHKDVPETMIDAQVDESKVSHGGRGNTSIKCYATDAIQSGTQQFIKRTTPSVRYARVCAG